MSFFAKDYFNAPFFQDNPFFKKDFFKVPFFSGLGTDLPSAPSTLDITDITATSMRATWEKIPEATHYIIDVLDVTNTVQQPGYPTTIIGNTKSITGLTTGTTYDIIVAAVNGNGTSSTIQIQRTTG